jgi:hypothetical protein
MVISLWVPAYGIVQRKAFIQSFKKEKLDQSYIVELSLV